MIIMYLQHLSSVIKGTKMSWMGTHCSEESKEALRALGYEHCRRCKYKAQLQFDKAIFSEHTCTRCGMKFPVDRINELKWFSKIRSM